jgi:hypothetical protein
VLALALTKNNSTEAPQYFSMMDSVTIGRSPVQKFGADHAGPTIYDDALKRPHVGKIMS